MISKYLNKLESYLQIDIRYITRSTSYLTIAQAASSVMGLAFTVILGILATKEEIGEFRYLLALVAVISAFTFTGFGTALTQSTAKYQSSLLREVFILRLKYCIPISLIGLGISLYYTIQNNITLALGLMLASLFVPLIESFKLVHSQNLGEQKISTLAVSSLATESIPYFFLVLTLFLTSNAFILVLVFLVTNTLIASFIFTATIKGMKNKIPTIEAAKLTIEEAKGELLRIKKYGVHMSVTNMLTQATQPLDQILIFQSIGSPELALYSYSQAIPARLRGFLRNTSIIALPRFSKKEYEETKKSLPKKLFLKLILISIAIAIYVLLSPILFKILFPNFLDAVFISQLSALTMVGSLTPDIWSALQAIEAKKTIQILAISSAILRLFILWLGLVFGGLLGIVIGNVVFNILQLLMVLFSYFYLKPS